MRGASEANERLFLWFLCCMDVNTSLEMRGDVVLCLCAEEVCTSDSSGSIMEGMRTQCYAYQSDV